jgi:hypothetical protein
MKAPLSARWIPFVCAAALLVLVAACSQSDGSSASKAPTPTTAAPDTTSPSAGQSVPSGGGTGGPTSGAVQLPKTADAYGQMAINAWLAGRDSDLQQLTSPAAYDQFKRLTRGGTWRFDNCEGAAGSSYCGFADGSGHRLVMRFSNQGPVQEGQPHGIEEVILES